MLNMIVKYELGSRYKSETIFSTIRSENLFCILVNSFNVYEELKSLKSIIAASNKIPVDPAGGCCYLDSA